MKKIGITGGVGCGKSAVLSYIREKYDCEILLTDDLARKLQEPGGVCYEAVVGLLGREVLGEDGKIVREKMAQRVFGDGALLQQINAIVHPAVKQEVMRQMEEAEKGGKVPFFFVEAALLIESGFDKICDELWYIYAEQSVRLERLAASRGYSEEKTRAVMARQLDEETFRAHCSVIIDNSGDFEGSKRQIDKALEAYS